MIIIIYLDLRLTLQEIYYYFGPFGPHSISRLLEFHRILPFFAKVSIFYL